MGFIPGQIEAIPHGHFIPNRYYSNQDERIAFGNWLAALIYLLFISNS